MNAAGRYGYEHRRCEGDAEMDVAHSVEFVFRPVEETAAFAAVSQPYSPAEAAAAPPSPPPPPLDGLWGDNGLEVAAQLDGHLGGHRRSYAPPTDEVQPETSSVITNCAACEAAASLHDGGGGSEVCAACRNKAHCCSICAAEVANNKNNTLANPKLFCDLIYSFSVVDLNRADMWALSVRWCGGLGSGKLAAHSSQS